MAVAEDDGESLSKMLQQKERIRSLITPGDEVGQNNSLLDKDCRREMVVKNQDGRSPYRGAQLKVVSINHRKQGADPIFEKDDPNSILGKYSDRLARDKSND